MRVSQETMTSGVLSAIYLLFILSGIKPPTFLAHLMQTTIGMGVLALMVLLTITHCAIPESVLAIIAAYELVRRSRVKSSNMNAMLCEKAKNASMMSYNHHEKTLEEEMVEKLAPVTTKDTKPASYRPVLNDIQDAAPIDYDGVI